DSYRSWQSLPLDERQRVSRQFNRFFELSGKERTQTLNEVAPNDRQWVGQMMAGLERLPEDERRRCLISMDQFATMTPTEREQFLRNAAQWETLSPEMRRTIRRVIAQLAPPPPLPPGFAPPIPPDNTAMTNTRQPQ